MNLVCSISVREDRWKVELSSEFTEFGGATLSKLNILWIFTERNVERSPAISYFHEEPLDCVSRCRNRITESIVWRCGLRRSRDALNRRLHVAVDSREPAQNRFDDTLVCLFSWFHINYMQLHDSWRENGEGEGVDIRIMWVILLLLEQWLHDANIALQNSESLNMQEIRYKSESHCLTQTPVGHSWLCRYWVSGLAFTQSVPPYFCFTMHIRHKPWQRPEMYASTATCTGYHCRGAMNSQASITCPAWPFQRRSRSKGAAELQCFLSANIMEQSRSDLMCDMACFCDVIHAVGRVSRYQLVLLTQFMVMIPLIRGHAYGVEMINALGHKQGVLVSRKSYFH